MKLLSTIALVLISISAFSQGIDKLEKVMGYSSLQVSLTYLRGLEVK